jgi:hypothetical protein
VYVDTSTSNLSQHVNSPHKNSTISSKYNSGFSSKCSQRASSMTDMITRGQPSGIGGAPMWPNMQRLVQIVIIERLLQPAASAIWEVVSNLLPIKSRIMTSWEGASRGAMAVCVVSLYVRKAERARWWFGYWMWQGYGHSKGGTASNKRQLS